MVRSEAPVVKVVKELAVMVVVPDKVKVVGSISITSSDWFLINSPFSKMISEVKSPASKLMPLVKVPAIN